MLNRGLVYVREKQIDAASADLSAALRLKPDFLEARNSLAHIEFSQGKFRQAAEDFSLSLTQTPDDAYSLIWRYLSRHRLGTHDTAELAEGSKGLKPEVWPYPVIAFYLDALSREALLAAAKNTADDKVRAEHECEAAAYLAEADMLRGDRASAKPLFEQAKASCPADFVEYTLAEMELKRIQATP